jgi:tetratricopeptide (TPR) repeat protein
LGLNPNHLDSHFIMAMVAHQTRAWETLESAAGHYLEILEWVTGHPEQSGYTVNNTANEGWRILLALGHSKLARGYPELAQEFFSQAISVAPNSALCHQMIAEFSLNCGSLEMAERHYRETIAKDPGRLDALLGLAKTCAAAGQVQECRDLMALLRSRDPQDTEMINEIGVSDLKSGDYESAIEVFERAVAQSPGQANLHINLALAYRKSSMTEKAIESNLNALRLNRNAQEALINLGNIYYEQGRFEEALPLFEKALDHDPTLLEVSLRLAWARLLGGNVVGCIQGCDALLKTLERPVDLLIHDLNDLAKVFLELARGFKEEGRELPSGEALEMAQQLNPGALNLEAQGH